MYNISYRKAWSHVVVWPSQEDELARRAALLRWGSLARVPINGHRILLMSRRSGGEWGWDLWDTYHRLLLNLRYGEEGLPQNRKEKLLRRDKNGRLRQWRGLPKKKLEQIELQLRPLVEEFRRVAEEARVWARARREGQ